MIENAERPFIAGELTDFIEHDLGLEGCISSSYNNDYGVCVQGYIDIVISDKIHINTLPTVVNNQHNNVIVNNQHEAISKLKKSELYRITHTNPCPATFHGAGVNDVNILAATALQMVVIDGNKYKPSIVEPNIAMFRLQLVLPDGDFKMVATDGDILYKCEPYMNNYGYISTLQFRLSKTDKFMIDSAIKCMLETQDEVV